MNAVLQIGSTVGNYKIVQFLGQSNFGSTYLAQRFVSGTGFEPTIKNFTIKALNLAALEAIGTNPTTLEKQVKILQRSSENPGCMKYISCYYDSFNQVIEGQPYLLVVTDYITGVSLQEMIDQQLAIGPFDLSVLMQMMYEIAEAVAFIHVNGIVHQNLKPTNIIRDETGRLRLIDFAMSCSQNLNSECKGKMGSIYYQPPELLALQSDPSGQPFAFRAKHDVWSMGVIFYQIANLGQNFITFTDQTPEALAVAIQTMPVNPSKYNYVPVNSIIAAILNKDPIERPTAGQTMALIKLGRPFCVVDEIDYNRSQSMAILLSMGIDVPRTTNDATLCTLLTDHVKQCQLKDKKYRKKDLLELAKMMGEKVPDTISSAQLCSMLQDGLQMKQEQYSRYISEQLFSAVSYLAWLKVELPGQPKTKPGLAEKLEKHAGAVYQTAKGMNLINMNYLNFRRQETTLKAKVYQANQNIQIGNIYAAIANRIVQLMADVDPDYRIDGQPIREYRQL